MDEHTPHSKDKAPARRRFDLALQGGGSHGAFTWGVLDRLLEDEELEIGGISGTSAGALNAAVLATGFARGGREGAREALAAFWKDVSHSSQVFSPFSVSQAGATGNHFNFDQLPSYQWLSSFFRAFSPYEFNPLNLNPLRDVVQRHVVERDLQRCDIPLFITATSVRTGQARVFTKRELGVDALLASACLPFIFQAVEVDGEPYWDGGYTGNPAIYPLIYNTEAMDIMLVKINPLSREALPTRAVEIIDRLSEITFNASLVAEMRAIAFVSRLVREGTLQAGRYKDLRLHMVADDDGLAPYNASSKFNTDWTFLQQLFELGRKAATHWLRYHRQDLGVRGSLDIEKVFLARHTLGRMPPAPRPANHNGG
ncbi:patatin-like phospholipase family protein [Methylibium rhizosphaerae]|jgi:NTE family protein|uniref:patatin-like phospholipase family protein n=1 Tax=Methylibium rhizosphaerae TaxID=2570323 RepID=UPI00112E6D7D|nr:patatin-like phospholipase family protein [Methylibium rhizosphaerae]